MAVECEQQDSLTKRAIRTRAPGQLLLRNGSTVYAEFCRDASVPLREVVEHVMGDLMPREVLEQRSLACDAVYAVLRRDHPCETDDDR